MKHLIILIIFTLLLFNLKGQTKRLSIGIGFNPTVQFQKTVGMGLGPSLTPFLNIKYLKQEIILGPDFYFFGPLYNKEIYPIIIGGQVDYRYHFLKQGKKYNFFLNSTLQYVQYQNTCLFAKPYNYIDPYVCYDYWGDLLKHRSFINTYGFGIEYNFLKRLYIYAIIGLGYNYSILNELDGSPYSKGNNINLIGTFRFGLSCSLITSKNERSK